MSKNLQFWNDCYSKGNTGWDRGGVHPFMVQLLDECLLEACKIIVPGCGRGYEVVKLAERGFEVTGIDIANEPLEHLRKQLVGFEANSIVAKTDFLTYQPGNPVDAVYEQTCLCAIDPGLRAEYEQTVFNWLKPGGRLFVLFVQKAESPNHGPPFHCNLEEMQLLFSTSRWSWQSINPIPRYEHPSGKMFELGFVLTKGDAASP